jgi:hypothetical protein
MAEILHMVGLCPDHFTHSNLIEFCLTNSQEFSWLYQKVNLSLSKLKIKKYGSGK